MAQFKGKSFQVSENQLRGVVKNILSYKKKADAINLQRMKIATNLVYRLARQRRPMISKTQSKKEGRTRRVSDPNAEMGVPVQTGELQASIQKNVIEGRDKITGEVYTDLYYAKYVEFGTSKMQARPFMRPALLHSKDAIKKVFSKKI